MTFTHTFTAILQREPFTMPPNLHVSPLGPLSAPSRLPSRPSRSTPFTLPPLFKEGKRGVKAPLMEGRRMKIRSIRGAAA